MKLKQLLLLLFMVDLAVTKVLKVFQCFWNITKSVSSNVLHQRELWMSLEYIKL